MPRLIEQDEVISYGGENGSCLGRWNGLRRPCLSVIPIGYKEQFWPTPRGYFVISSWRRCHI